LPLDMLAANPNVSDSDKVGEVARQFEAVLLRQILQEARKSDDPGDDTTVSGIYDDMINNQLADTISRSGEFGLARGLKAQLTHQVLQSANDSLSSACAPSTKTPNSETQ